MARIRFDQTTTYCETSDVARWFEQYDDFDTSTNPTAKDVEDHIAEWSEYIDRQTGHAWRDNTVVNEYKDITGPYYWWSGNPLGLTKRNVRNFDPEEGDALEVWDGTEWNDWLTDNSFKQGRRDEYWIENEAGKLWIFERFVFRRHPRLRVTYRYGYPEGPTRQITMACSKLVAADLLTTDQYSMNVPGTEGSISEEQMAEQWREDAEDVISERKEIEFVEPY